MKLDKIITLANEHVRLPFLAFERSLRATGCNLPLFVIPYDDNQFDLPDNATWWVDQEFIEWIDTNGRRPVMRKYQVLLESNYQFLDTDAVFLKNPVDVLAPHTGWINSCCHWNNPAATTTAQSRVILRQRSTTWAQKIFNTGQFACDRQLYTAETLKRTCDDAVISQIVLEDEFHEQPGLNILVHLSEIPITNLTLPPYCMESTWAGDYLDDNYTATWGSEQRKPYIIHWAGRKMDGSTPIDTLALNYLTAKEQDEWISRLKENAASTIPERFRRSIKSAISSSIKG
ncbi:hypothetical protein [Rubellicoccus peritrichatus]|uniref:Nucleotide-diphospho-sugar transferase domain-containing protein n=1 Tax=Rubellicoccus peritrichatus TaxID=3080537 RepID=A0AAQ3QT16_9BACT|nr:hypothetical protein [Puniceicoccus sp. CR14]WOO40816.1 hypothetical protein RZN69_19505 [Puniceicoccus sp. CR14]